MVTTSQKGSSPTILSRTHRGAGAIPVTSHRVSLVHFLPLAFRFLVDLIYSVNAGYRQNGVFVMNRKTQSTIRKFKDSTGNYLWQPPAIPGAKATLMTFPVIEAEDMPDIAANSLSIAFGDFNRGYLIVDRSGLTVLRDPYTAKPYVLFYTTKRVGGGVQDFSAIKLLKFSAS